MRDPQAVIDEIVGTAFNTAATYGVKPALLKETKRRIQKQLATLDEKTKKTGKYDSRTKGLFEFLELPLAEQQRIAKQARDKHVLIEKEYSSDAARN